MGLGAAATIGLFFFTVTNPFVIWWQAYYVYCTVDPIANQSKATNDVSGRNFTLRSEFIGIVCLGFILLILNGGVALIVTLLLFDYKWDSEYTRAYKVMPNIPRNVRRYVLLPVMLAVGGFVTFGPFVSPFLSADIAWKLKYRHTCDGMNVRVYLDTPETRHADLVEFANLTSGERYAMSMQPDPEIWGLASNNIYNFSLVDTGKVVLEQNSTFVPTWKYIQYNLKEGTFSVFSPNNTAINSGNFLLGKLFRIPNLNIIGDLEAFARRCVFDPTAEIYEEQYNGRQAEKKMVMKTAQFKICDLLQVCADDWFGDMTAVPVGLLMLQRAGRPSKCCKGKVMPGVAGRDSGRDGNG